MKQRLRTSYLSLLVSSVSSVIVIMLCFQKRQFTLTVPLSTLEYKWTKGMFAKSWLDLNRITTLETRDKEWFSSYMNSFLLFFSFHQATSQRLISHVVADHSAIDPTYVEDLLLTYRTFLDRPSEICSQLLNWFLERRFRDKVKIFLKRASNAEKKTAVWILQ